jgi:hypothetical protein
VLFAALYEKILLKISQISKKDLSSKKIHYIMYLEKGEDGRLTLSGNLMIRYLPFSGTYKMVGSGLGTR